MTLRELDDLVQSWKAMYPDTTDILVLKGTTNTALAQGLDGDTWSYEWHEGEQYLTFVLPT